MYVQSYSEFLTLDPSTGVVLDSKPLFPKIANRGLVYVDGRVYFLDQNILIKRDQVFSINPATGRAKLLGLTGFSYDYAAVALARDPASGRIYITFATGLFEMHQSTGAIRFLHRLYPDEAVDTLAIDSDGKAFGISQPSASHARNRLLRVNLHTGIVTELGPLNTGLGYFSAIAFDGSDQLWGVFTPGAAPFNHTLYKIDIATLTATEAFALPQGASGIAFGPAPRAGTYCTGKPSSTGCTPRIGWRGHPSAAAHLGFEVTCVDVVNQTIGVLMVGTGGRDAVPFQGGTLCLAPPWTTVAASSSGGSAPPSSDCTGTWEVDLNAFLYHHLPQPAGAVVGCQWWGRDPGLPPPHDSQLSDALEVVLMP
jgi:hypothetical protein